MCEFLAVVYLERLDELVMMSYIGYVYMSGLYFYAVTCIPQKQENKNASN